MTIQGITEEDIANYLAHTPGFFQRHAELLATIQLTSPHGQRAVSLQERQMEMLREKHKALERKIIEMIRYGQENVAIANRLHQWALELLQAADAAQLPRILIETLQHEFLIPQATLKLWDVAEPYLSLPHAQAISDDAKSFATSLRHAYAGMHSGFEAVTWLAEPSSVMSVALIPLRRPDNTTEESPAFGLIVLASPDPTRYNADMGIEFLTQIGDIASAALSRLLIQTPLA